MSMLLRPTLRTTHGFGLRSASSALSGTMRHYRPAPITPLTQTMRGLRLGPATTSSLIGLGIKPTTASNLEFMLAPGARGVASQVTVKPGSQTFEHAKQNVKEELGNSAADLAKSIAGNPVDSILLPERGDLSFAGITSAVAHQVPQPILVLGLMGGIPYIGASGMTLWLARQAELASSGVMTRIDPGVASTLLDQALNFQVTYGAVMLSFLGALHWGFEMAAYGGHKGYTRLALGTAPMIVAWTSLGMQPMEALVLQWFAFTGLWYADSRATMLGWTPKWYSQYRFYLSILIGFCIIGSLAGTSYFGPVAGHGFLTHELDELRERRRSNMPQKHGLIRGDVEAVPAGPEADKFTRIHHK